MDPREAIPILECIIARERKDGCPMAHESLIAPAVRRWKTYKRRNKRNKNKSLEHRAHDLEKGLLALFPDHSYDPGCLHHLAQSFAEVFFKGSVDDSETSRHTTVGEKKVCQELL
jgi:hypothetical protein